MSLPITDWRGFSRIRKCESFVGPHGITCNTTRGGGVVENSYREFLEEEIEIHRLMLARDLISSTNQVPDNRFGTLLSKIRELEMQLADYEDQFAA